MITSWWGLIPKLLIIIASLHMAVKRHVNSGTMKILSLILAVQSPADSDFENLPAWQISKRHTQSKTERWTNVLSTDSGQQKQRITSSYWDRKILLQGGDSLNRLKPFYRLLKSLSCPSPITVKVLSSRAPLLAPQMFQRNRICGYRAARGSKSVNHPGRTSCFYSAR